jgi:hypothetical protein
MHNALPSGVVGLCLGGRDQQLGLERAILRNQPNNKDLPCDDMQIQTTVISVSCP